MLQVQRLWQPNISGRVVGSTNSQSAIGLFLSMPSAQLASAFCGVRKKRTSEQFVVVEARSSTEVKLLSFRSLASWPLAILYASQVNLDHSASMHRASTSLNIPHHTLS